jgi:hypothetical protein
MLTCWTDFKLLIGDHSASIMMHDWSITIVDLGLTKSHRLEAQLECSILSCPGALRQLCSPLVSSLGSSSHDLESDSDDKFTDNERLPHFAAAVFFFLVGSVSECCVGRFAVNVDETV